MKPVNYSPSRSLAPYVKEYKVIGSVPGRTNRVLPEGNMALAFRYKGSTSYVHGVREEVLGDVVVSGLRKTARLIKYEENSAAVIVIFKEGGAAAFFRQPVNEFYGESVALDQVIEKTESERVLYQLMAVAGDSQDADLRRIEVIEAFLLRRLINVAEDSMVLAAVQQIKLSRGAVRIRELAGALYVSQDAFEKRFRRVMGATPKQYSSIIRMRQLLSDKRNENLLDLTFTSGFYDQAHFNHEFKMFTGLTPKELFKSPLYW